MSNGYSITSIKPTLTSIVVRPPFLNRLPHSNVHLVGNAAKAHLFRREIPFTTNKKAISSTTLNKLELLSPSTASLLSLRSDDIQDLRFRLYSDHGVRPREDSYVALSYRWSEFSRSFRKLPGYTQDFPIPTSLAMFQAVLNERRSENEGLWVDQICIDQDDDAEKAVSIGAMDTIYKSARVVVIALDDVIVTDDEAKVLKAHSDMVHLSRSSHGPDLPSPYFEDGILSNRKTAIRVFHDTIKKIVESEYFERAWCHHELRLGREHIFLVPRIDLRTSNPHSHSFIRFNGAFLYYSVLLHANDSPSTAKLERIKRDLHSIFLKKDFAEDSNRQNIDDITKYQLDAFHSYTHSIAEVFNSKAGGNPLLPTKDLRDRDANHDKMSIALNATDSGLILRQCSNKAYNKYIRTLEQCQQHIMLVALAAGDPVVLCTTGSPLKSQNGKSSWLCWPHSGDIDIGHFFPIAPIPPNTSLIVNQNATSEFIELDLLFIHSTPSSSRTTDSSSFPHFSHAENFLDQCIEENIGGQSLYWESWRTEADAERKSPRNLFTRTLAAIFSCGKQWIMQVSLHLGIDHTTLAGALSYLFTEEIEQRMDNWWMIPEGQESARHLLELLRTITGKNLKLLPSNIKPTLFEGPMGQLCLAFISSASPLHLAIPAVLTSEDYDFLSRCWVLSRIDDPDSCSKWRMLGKSRIFGAKSFSTNGTYGSGFQRKQRVYGPELLPSRP